MWALTIALCVTPVGMGCYPIYKEVVEVQSEEECVAYAAEVTSRMRGTPEKPFVGYNCSPEGKDA